LADETGLAGCGKATGEGGEPVTGDDDRIAYLAGDTARPVDAADREDLDGLRALLADPSTWEKPDPALEGRVLAAVTLVSGARPSRAPRARSRRFRPGLVYTAFAAAAAVVAVVVVGVTLGGTGTSAEHFSVSLAATDLAPGASGNATLTKSTPGWRIELTVTGLPRRDNGRYYEAWLKNSAGILVPVGTFNQGSSVTLWAGVPPTSFPTLTITEQQAGRDQASSGKRVLTGSVGLRH
jgi:Anti-sigma-K factor rskA